MDYIASRHPGGLGAACLRLWHWIINPDRIRPTWRSWWRASLIEMPLTFAIACVVYLAFELLGLPHYELPEMKPSLLLVSAVLIAPLLETLVVIGLLALGRRFLGNTPWLPSLFAGLAFAATHLSNHWENALSVIWFFVWQGYCYQLLRRKGSSWGQRYRYLAGMHALHNGVATLPWLCFY